MFLIYNVIFIYLYSLSAVDEFGEATPKVGFFHIFKKSEFLVKRWDAKEEDISSESMIALNVLE